ncbi:unnamed protein product [Absidia cylindrospora]
MDQRLLQGLEQHPGSPALMPTVEPPLRQQPQVATLRTERITSTNARTRQYHQLGLYRDPSPTAVPGPNVSAAPHVFDYGGDDLDFDCDAPVYRSTRRSTSGSDDDEKWKELIPKLVNAYLISCASKKPDILMNDEHLVTCDCEAPTKKVTCFYSTRTRRRHFMSSSWVYRVMLVTYSLHHSMGFQSFSLLPFMVERSYLELSGTVMNGVDKVLFGDSEV